MNILKDYNHILYKGEKVLHKLNNTDNGSKIRV